MAPGGCNGIYRPHNELPRTELGAREKGARARLGARGGHIPACHARAAHHDGADAAHAAQGLTQQPKARNDFGKYLCSGNRPVETAAGGQNRSRNPISESNPGQLSLSTVAYR